MSLLWMRLHLGNYLPLIVTSISHAIGTSIDFETDTKIQEALRDEFVNSTVITIAHRLQTIMDYDRVVRDCLGAYCLLRDLRDINRSSWMLAELSKTVPPRTYCQHGRSLPFYVCQGRDLGIVRPYGYGNWRMRMESKPGDSEVAVIYSMKQSCLW